MLLLGRCPRGFTSLPVRLPCFTLWNRLLILCICICILRTANTLLRQSLSAKHEVKKALARFSPSISPLRSAPFHVLFTLRFYSRLFPLTYLIVDIIYSKNAPKHRHSMRALSESMRCRAVTERRIPCQVENTEKSRNVEHVRRGEPERQNPTEMQRIRGFLASAPDMTSPHFALSYLDPHQCCHAALPFTLQRSGTFPTKKGKDSTTQLSLLGLWSPETATVASLFGVESLVHN
jgi:hypothetical protein